ncbi:MAG: ATP-dependent DNA helicase [Actinomycetota bacterium]
MTPSSFEPDTAQAAVLAHEGGALLVTGGAGTGKSAVLRERFARLLEGGADPERVALVVRSKRAKDEARAALLDRIHGSLPSLRVLTIHGLASAVVTERRADLGYDEPPEILSAADQFAKVRELMADQDPSAWPAYGRMLELRGFADEVRQFLSRAQESLLAPADIEAAATERGLRGWQELADFLREYQQVMDGLNVVDLAAMVQRAAMVAGKGEPLFDHVLVDDLQDSTFAAEALLLGLRAPDLVAAGDPGAHVFSFQGTTDVPILRFTQRFGATHVPLETPHRAPTHVALEAWCASHISEEHAAVARELRRIHVDEGVPWADLAVIVRRQGSHLAGLLRALDDARVPRAVPESGLSLGAEPATFPYVLALRWLARPDEREQLIESILTGDIVSLSPAAARGLMRTALAVDGTVASALHHTDGLSPAQVLDVDASRDALARAEEVAARSVLDAFKILWDDLPCSRRLVAAADGSPDARRELDAVVALANIVAEAGVGTDRSVQAFVESLEAGEHGPGYAASERGRTDAVQVLTAHGAAGREFDTVLVAGAVEGSFPSLHRPEPMFDLAVLQGQITRSARNRLRLEDERRLFRMVVGRARRRVVAVASDAHGDDADRSARSRFVDEAGVPWTDPPAGPYDEPVSVPEAAASWRRTLATLDAPAATRLAALDGLVALGVDPRRWWFQRDWTDTGRPLHDTLRLSYSKLSKLENCELQHVLSDELGLGRPGGYHAWVGKTVHKLIEEVERGELPREPSAITAALDARWRPQEFPSIAVSEAFRYLGKTRMLKNWFDRYAQIPSLAIERYFDFEFEGATIVGYIDRIGPTVQGGTCITDYKSGAAPKGVKVEDSLQLGIYFLAVNSAEELAEFRPVTAVELAYLKGDWRDGTIELRRWQVPERETEAYQERVRVKLAELIAREKELIAAETYRPNPAANCFFCEYKTLCSLWPEGRPVFGNVDA